jgi:hypothetical protein
MEAEVKSEFRLSGSDRAGQIATEVVGLQYLHVGRIQRKWLPGFGRLEEGLRRGERKQEEEKSAVRNPSK